MTSRHVVGAVAARTVAFFPCVPRGFAAGVAFLSFLDFESPVHGSFAGALGF
jgi:hypothetical protein